MRNYNTGRKRRTDVAIQDNSSDNHHSRLVIEDNTIYEIDMDCYECMKKKRCSGTDEPKK